MALAGTSPAQAPGCSGRPVTPFFTQERAAYVAEIFEASEAHRADPAAPVSAPPANAPDARVGSILQRGDVEFTCLPAAFLTGRRNE